jgi:hypothetical protein
MQKVASEGMMGMEHTIPVTVELAQDIYEEAARLARYRGETLGEFVTAAVMLAVAAERAEYAYGDYPLGPAPGWENKE